MKAVQSILNLIGNTPLVEIRNLNPNPAARVLAKLEYFNPGGSIKDRAALFMIQEGEASGDLVPGKTVIEATSGNTGIGLALVCAVKGYKLLLTMSESASVERQKILKARGAEILLTPGHLGTDGAIEEVYRMAREKPEKYFMTDQFNNEANWKAHYQGTAPEIWEQTAGRVSAVVATLGTSGTLMGLSRRLKQFNAQVQIIGVEPYLGHKIQGLKNMKESYRPGIFDKTLLDKTVNIDDDEAFEMTRRLAREEGLLVGMSSGAAMAVAIKEAQNMHSGTLVVVLPDGGERYLSTPLFTVKEKVELRLYNTMSRRKEPFEPLNSDHVSMYTCGPTADGTVGLGEFRRFLVADLLCRYLQFRGYSVNHVLNITDLDDHTIDNSDHAGESLETYTRKHIDAFKNELVQLGVQPAEAYPLTSEHTEDMVRLAERLVDKGFAYEKLRSLYFDISRFPSYGNLSGIDINKIRLGVTVDLNEYEKDNPRDFTLFKRARLSELKRGIYSKTRWGSVRPSWHLQAAAICMKFFGEHCDIHTSSRELVFPHHENVVAISTAATGKSPARFWLDCDRVLVDGKKTVGGESLQDVLKYGYSSREVRCWLLSTHYRKPLLFKTERLDDSRRSLERLGNCVRNLKKIDRGQPHADLSQLLYDIKQGFINGMDDDLNVSAALAALFKAVKKINTLIRSRMIDPEGAAKVIETFRNIDRVLNIFDFGEIEDDLEIRKLIAEREKARAERNWLLADRLREQLSARGVKVEDRRLDEIEKA